MYHVLIPLIVNKIPILHFQSFLIWKDSDISKTSNLLVSKSLGWWWLGGWSYDYNISRSPNLWNERLKTFDLDLDLGLTMIVF